MFTGRRCGRRTVFLDPDARRGRVLERRDLAAALKNFSLATGGRA